MSKTGTIQRKPEYRVFSKCFAGQWIQFSGYYESNNMFDVRGKYSMVPYEIPQNSKIFNVAYNGLELEFELFRSEYIYAELIQMQQKNLIESVYEILIPSDMGKYSLGKYLQAKCDNEKCMKYYFFSYIKFFDYNGLQYGLVGGKTNYRRPDVLFDFLGENDNRISRTFLADKGLQWSKKIIILNHASKLIYLEDEKQSKFIECFVQRKFNLFDS